MRFAHIADCHLGCWRQPEMQQLNLIAFEKAIDRCISEGVDFVLIAGDLFDTAVPSVNILKSAAGKLRELKEKNINCFIVQGSHDFSASGKSMVSVLEKAGLCADVSDNPVKKSYEGKSVLIAGLSGKKGGLEQNEISSKIFEGRGNSDISILMVHTTVSELSNLPSCVSSVPLKDIPNGFDYYALGHIHQQGILESGGRTIAYAGSLFPTNFSELESQHNSVFFIIEADGKITKKSIRRVIEPIKPVVNVFVDANTENPQTLAEKIRKELEKNRNSFKDAVVTLRVSGILESGKPSDIDFNSIEAEPKKSGAFFVLRNISKLESREFELKIDENASEINDIGKLEELSIDVAVKEGVISDDKKQVVEILLKKFNVEKIEDETNSTFCERLTKEMLNALGLEDDFK